MPPKKPKTEAIAILPAEVDRRIQVIRNVRVMLDFDLAELYDVPTMRLNEQVKRNKDRFPHDFSFILEPHEVMVLMSQNAISKPGRGGRTKPIRAFTEQGIAMLSSVLRSETAVRVNIEIMRGFVRLRRLLATPGELVAQLQKLAETVEIHDSQIKGIIDILQKMVAPPPDSAPKRRIGFADANTDSPNEERK